MVAVGDSIRFMIGKPKEEQVKCPASRKKDLKILKKFSSAGHPILGDHGGQPPQVGTVQSRV
jgi:hypothetical protein